MSAQAIDLSDLLVESDIDDIESPGRPLKKRRIDQRGRHWFLTWNNPPENGVDILAGICLMCTHYVYQKEQGDSGTPHWQGCFAVR